MMTWASVALSVAGMVRLLLRTAIFAGAISSLAAAPAAATVQVSRDSASALRITDVSALVDGITLQGGGLSDLRIFSTQPLSRSASATNCTNPVPVGSQCTMTCSGSGISSIIVTLSTGNDSYSDFRPSAGVSGTTGSPTTVSGGTGNDVIFTSNEEVQSPFTIQGGSGADSYRLDTSDVDGIMVRDSGATASVTTGGGGGIANTVDIESFRTGSSPDIINGSAVPATAALRTYDGHLGPDSLIGTPRADTLIGGHGSDILLGGDGNDFLNAKAGELTATPDIRFDCGAGADTAAIDLTDPDPVGCETVNRSAIGERPHLRIRAPRLRRGATADVELRCPARVEHPCRGTLRLAFRMRGLDRADPLRYRVPAGTERLARVGLNARRARRGRAVFLRSTEQGDVRGLKTTTVRRRLR